ncbi:MAG: 4a-hydroxytetrahydrobiopterin dehydratase [Bacteroidia bacterium]|nr:4a-hydroxytetrahydrobiopterin dehydratase [Bacteroidia bacterium]MCZ2141621.1 4a-hydroxytetrahydrobiopterin dehydratase [Bacteroidia bacterium]
MLLIPNHWTLNKEALYRKFVFKVFNTAFEFIAKVALIAQEQNHHPTWTNTYNTVEIWLITHDANNSITDKNIEMAIAINSITEP